MSKILNTVLAAAALAASATAASANPIVVDGAADYQVRASIDIRGLDAGEIDRRIGVAARRVCGAAESHSVAAIARVNACRSAAEADAREQVASLAGATRVTLAAIY